MTLADKIINHQPFTQDLLVGAGFSSDLCWVRAADLNTLRDELIELRQPQAAAEARERIRVEAIFTTGPDLSIQCACRHWAVHIDKALTLAELNRRADQHTEECR